MTSAAGVAAPPLAIPPHSRNAFARTVPQRREVVGGDGHEARHAGPDRSGINARRAGGTSVRRIVTFGLCALALLMLAAGQTKDDFEF